MPASEDGAQPQLMKLYHRGMRAPFILPCLFAVSFTIGLACRGDVEYAGQPCESPDDCYPEVADLSELRGEVECLDKVSGGYCTHLCQTDADCCAVEGECNSDFPQVCGPFENQPDMRCFLSCEDENLVDGLTGDEYCQTYAHPDFGCRSTGGGSANRKVCVP